MAEPKKIVTTDTIDELGHEVRTVVDASAAAVLANVAGAGYQTAAQVDAAVAAKGYQTAADVSETLVAGGYTTMPAVEAKGYQTAAQVDSAVQAKGYQTADQVDALVEAKGYQTASQVNDAIIEAELGGDVDLSEYVKHDELDEALSGYQTVSGMGEYATETWVGQQLSAYASTADVNDALSGYVTQTALSNTLDAYQTVEGMSGYVTDAGLANELTNYVSGNDLDERLSAYATNEGVTAALAGYVTDEALAGELSGYVTDEALSADLAPYATTAAVNQALSGYVTTGALADELDGYVTDAELAGAGYQTAAQVQTAIGSALSAVMTYKGVVADAAALPASGQAVGDVWHVSADGSERAWDGAEWQELGTAVDLSAYATTAAVEQELSGYVTDAELAEAGFITSVPLATVGSPGAVIPDGTSITVAANGTISVNSGGADITGLANRIARLECVVFETELTTNPWALDLSDSEGWTLLAGTWDEETGRVHG